MRKVFWLMLFAVAVAAAIWYGRRIAEKNATIAVTSLLPAETLFVMHLPDFNQTREQWHQTDIYKIRQEPEVREFLQKPLAQFRKQKRPRKTWRNSRNLRRKIFSLRLHPGLTE